MDGLMFTLGTVDEVVSHSHSYNYSHDDDDDNDRDHY